MIAVAGTGRDPQRVREALGGHENLLAVALDITSEEAVEAAVKAAVERFRRIDVLVNNAANFYVGYLEELTPEQYRAQLETNLSGPVNVTRAMLPVMREQRSGHVISIGSEWSAASAPLGTTSQSSPSKDSWRPSGSTSPPLRNQDHCRRAGILPHRTGGRRRLPDLAGAGNR